MSDDLFSAVNEPVAPKEYYTIGEVCELTGLKPHVLRYWESQFDLLRPKKNRAGNRVFRPGDVELVVLLKRLLYDDKYTIEGARRRLDEVRRAGDLPAERRGARDWEFLEGMKSDLREILEILGPSGPSQGGGVRP